HAAGRMVVQYRDQILPLVDLAAQFSDSAQEPLDDTVQVIVFVDGARRVGLLVGQIVDIVEDTVTVKKTSQRPGVLGSAVVGGKITDFLDLHWVIGRVEENWFEARGGVGLATTV